MEKQYYRTFIGLPVKVGDGFLKARQVLIDSLSGERISWVDPEQYHITLRFIGDTKISVVKDIGRALLKGVELPEKLDVIMTQPGSFGPRKRPRVIWIGFEQPMLFESLKEDVDRSLKKCGIVSLDQPFRAHLTLGRVRSIKDLNKFYSAIEDMKDRFTYQVLLDRLVLFRSEIGKGSPVYTPLYQMKFRD